MNLIAESAGRRWAAEVWGRHVGCVDRCNDKPWQPPPSIVFGMAGAMLGRAPSLRDMLGFQLGAQVRWLELGGKLQPASEA